MKRALLPLRDVEQLGALPAGCLGAMQWGGATSEAHAHALLDFAVKERGVRMIDTAEVYPLPLGVETHGASERIVGAWLRANPEWRARVVVATKVAGPLRSSFLGAGRLPEHGFCAANVASISARQGGRARSGLTRAEILAAAAASLARLSCGAIDLLYLHWPDRSVPLYGSTQFDPRRAAAGRAEEPALGEMVAAVGELLASGSVRAWGLSNENAYGVLALCFEADRQGVRRPVALQNELSLLNRHFENDSLAEACWRLGLRLVAYSPLAGGALTGKYVASDEASWPSCGSSPASSSPQPQAQEQEQMQMEGKANVQAQAQALLQPAPNGRLAVPGKAASRYNSPRVTAAVAAYQEAARSHGEAPLAPAALRWLLHRPCAPIVVVGASSLEQLGANLDALCGPPLEPALAGTFDAIYLQHKDPVCWL
jgi:aryl-alcohol dehydrogenase-like predicted oxidoreductase